jgi:DNA-binding CsgD family transcriptional regulator
MREKRQKGKEDKREKRKEVRERINRLFEIGLRSKEISRILGIPPRTVRYYLQGAEFPRLPLRTRITHRDIVWIEKLIASGATIEEISEILRLSGRVVFKAIQEIRIKEREIKEPVCVQRTGREVSNP